jgi:hypothetical protein
MRFSIPKTLAVLALSTVFIIGAVSTCKAAADDDNVVLSASNEIALSKIEMDSNRGAASINTLTSTQTLQAATSGNSFNVGGSLTNGNIALGNNFNGFGTYLMNTGNNSTLNAALNLSVQLMAGP